MERSLFSDLPTIFLLFGLVYTLILVSPDVRAQENGVIVEDAEYILYDSSLYSADLINTARIVTPRVLVEYSDNAMQHFLYKSNELNSIASVVAERITVEYADSLFEYDLQVAALPDTPQRMVVEYADSILSRSLMRPPSPLTSPPVTNLTLDGVLGLNGWFTSNVVVSMSVNVPVERTEYSFDGVTWLNFTGPFTLNEEGYHHFHYRSIDKAGNVEQTREEIIKIDKTPPAGDVQIDAGALYTDSRKVTLTLSATDALSGVSQMRFIKYGELTPWEPYTMQKSWNLSLAEQELPAYLRTQNITVTLRAQFIDNAGLVSNASDTIIFTLRVPTPVSLNKPTNVTTTASYYSVLLTWSQNTDPDFLCYQIVSSSEPLQPYTSYVDEWFFEENGGQLIYDRSITSYKIEYIPTSFPRYYFIVRTYNKQWIYSDSNVMVAEYTSPSPGPLPLPYFPWLLETILVSISGIFGISAASFITYRMYKNRKIERQGIESSKTKIKQYSWVDLLMGGISGLIPIFLWLQLYHHLSPIGFVAVSMSNLFINSILFNVLLFGGLFIKATLSRCLTRITLYVLYFSFTVFASYISSGGTVIEYSPFIAYAIAVYIPIINVVACPTAWGLGVQYSLGLGPSGILPIPSYVPVLFAAISSPLYSFPLTLYIIQKLHKRYDILLVAHAG